MDWEECKYKKLVKEVKVDNNLIESLIKSSDKKIKTNNRLELDETTASTKVSVVYEALKEILEALAIKMGFKIYNHECFCGFLEEIYNDKSSSISFDRFRKIRNQINYYGKDIPLDDATSIIKDIFLLINKLKEYLKEKR